MKTKLVKKYIAIHLGSFSSFKARKCHRKKKFGSNSKVFRCFSWCYFYTFVLLTSDVKFEIWFSNIFAYFPVILFFRFLILLYSLQDPDLGAATPDIRSMDIATFLIELNWATNGSGWLIFVLIPLLTSSVLLLEFVHSTSVIQ